MKFETRSDYFVLRRDFKRKYFAHSRGPHVTPYSIITASIFWSDFEGFQVMRMKLTVLSYLYLPHPKDSHLFHLLLTHLLAPGSTTTDKIRDNSPYILLLHIASEARWHIASCDLQIKREFLIFLFTCNPTSCTAAMHKWLKVLFPSSRTKIKFLKCAGFCAFFFAFAYKKESRGFEE